MSSSSLSCEKEIIRLTQKYYKEVTDIWMTLFNEETIKDHETRLIGHVKFFYDDLVEQSLVRRNSMLKEIEDLKQESLELQRMLGITVKPTKQRKQNNGALRSDDNSDDHDDDNGEDYSEHYPLLIYQAELDRNIEIYRQQVRDKREQINDLLMEQESLCEELDEMPKELPTNPLPSDHELLEFRNYLDGLHKEKVERANSIKTMRQEIKHYLQLLNATIKTDTENHLLNGRNIDVTRTTFDSVKRLHNTYELKVHEQNDSINIMRRKLNDLWERLRIPTAHRTDISRHTELNYETYQILYDELKRCEAQKSQNIKLYVNEIRDEITEWWDKTLKSEAQRKRFTNFNSSCYTEDLLLLHEMELEELKTFYRDNEEIFQLFADRNILWDRMQALEARATEPGRYNNRGGQLLKEEKERKTIASKLPKVEQQIEELVQQYQEREHIPFLVYGENIIDLMANQWELKRLEKKTAIRNKNSTMSSSTHGGAGVGGSSLISKSNFNGTRTPIGMKNVSSMFSLRSASSNHNLAGISGSGRTNHSAFKRKLNPSEITNPLAKRSLLVSLESPSVRGGGGGTTVGGIGSVGVTAAGNQQQQQHLRLKSTVTTPFKSPLKKPQHKVIGTTIRRRSHGRYSGSGKKRRSLIGKSSATKRGAAGTGVAVPKLMVTEENHNNDGRSEMLTTDDEDHGLTENRRQQRPNDTYASFQKCIEPSSQSSIIQDHNQISPSASEGTTATTATTASSNSNTSRRQALINAIEKENIRCVRGSKHQLMGRRTPIKERNVGGNSKRVLTTTSSKISSSIKSRNTSNGSGGSSSRKVLPKNLPILI